MVRRGRDLALAPVASAGGMFFALLLGPVAIAAAAAFTLLPERRDAYLYGPAPQPAPRSVIAAAALMLAWPWLVLTLAQGMQWI